MASRASIVEYLVEQLGAGVSSRAMFGEYAVYRQGLVIGLVCDDRLFLKQTAAGRALLGDEVQEAPAYPGAKPSLVVPEERWEDDEFMAALARVTAEGLPAPKLRAVAKGGAVKSIAKRAAAKPRSRATAKPTATPRATAKPHAAKRRAAKPTTRSRATAKPTATPRATAKPHAAKRGAVKSVAKRAAAKPTATPRAAKPKSHATKAKPRAVKPRATKRRAS